MADGVITTCPIVVLHSRWKFQISCGILKNRHLEWLSLVFWKELWACTFEMSWFWFAPPTRMEEKVQKQRKHQQKHSGPKAQKKKLRKQAGAADGDERKRNPKAFAVQSAVRMAKTFHRFSRTPLTSDGFAVLRPQLYRWWDFVFAGPRT